MEQRSHAQEFDVVGDELALIYVRRSKPYPKKKKQDQRLEDEEFDKLSQEEASVEAKMPSIETQIASCEKMAEVKHVKVAGIYMDIRTGTTLARKGLDALRKRIKSKALPRIKYIFVHALDRLSRGDQADLYLLEREFKHCGVKVLSATEKLEGDTPEDEIMRTMLQAFARFEVAKMKERQARRNKYRVEVEKKIPRRGQPKYGYMWGPDMGSYVKHPEEAPVVRSIMDMRIHEGLSGPKIATHLNEKGYRRRGGGLWTAQDINEICRDPLYTGVFTRNRYSFVWGETTRGSVRDERGLPIPFEEREPRISKLRIKGEGVKMEGVVEPIITQEEYLLVRGVAEANKWAAKKHRTDPEATLLQGGYVVCGHCLRIMNAFRKEQGKPDENYMVYVCVSTPPPGKKHKGIHIATNLLDRIAWEACGHVLEDLDHVNALAYARLNALTTEQGEGCENLDESIAETEQQLARFTEDYRTAKDQPAGAVVLILLNETASRLEELKAKKAGKLPRQTEIDEEKKRIQGFLSWATEAAGKYEKADWNWKRVTIHMLGLRVLVYGSDSSGPVFEDGERKRYEVQFYPFGLRRDLQ
ncbi:MAG TPA: recombinase family protein [Ktedonosporobacter sp.]|nr:recombinase family protein [Ktedonosporobacter sp.]